MTKGGGGGGGGGNRLAITAMANVTTFEKKDLHALATKLRNLAEREVSTWMMISPPMPVSPARHHLRHQPLIHTYVRGIQV